MKPLDIFAGLGVLLCWGLTFPIAKIGLTELPAFNHDHVTLWADGTAVGTTLAAT
jgi:hypothetical protein